MLHNIWYNLGLWKTSPYTYRKTDDWKKLKSCIYQQMLLYNQNRVTLHLYLQRLGSPFLHLLRTPSHSLCNQIWPSQTSVWQIDLLHHQGSLVTSRSNNLWKNFSCFSVLEWKTVLYFWHLSSTLVCSCYNTPWKSHIGMIHLH